MDFNYAVIEVKPPIADDLRRDLEKLSNFKRAGYCRALYLLYGYEAPALLPQVLQLRKLVADPAIEIWIHSRDGSPAEPAVVAFVATTESSQSPVAVAFRKDKARRWLSSPTPSFLDDYIAPERPLSASMIFSSLMRSSSRYCLSSTRRRAARVCRLFSPAALFSHPPQPHAADAFSAGAADIKRYVEALPERHLLGVYLSALSRFEIAALHGYAALDSIRELMKVLNVTSPPFDDPDRLLPRVKDLANRVRHEQEDAGNQQTSNDASAADLARRPRRQP